VTEILTRDDARPRTGLKGRIAENRRQIDVELARDPDERRRISPALAGLSEQLLPRLRRHAKGRFLDAGCGTQPFRAEVEPHVDRYLAYDIEARVADVDFLGDIEDMGVVPTASVDSMLCSEVLEHVPHPSRAVAEFARILTPGGSLIVTVPFLSRLHEEPHDYFRYTRYGLRTLLDDAGFDVDEIAETGSLFSFVGHQVSVALLGLTWHIPVVRRVAMTANALLVVRPATLLDRAIRLARLLPLGYVVVATRRP
jgi:SAM-dependent methyltransferase